MEEKIIALKNDALLLFRNFFSKMYHENLIEIHLL